jgi:hypothetical protein
VERCAGSSLTALRTGPAQQIVELGNQGVPGEGVGWVGWLIDGQSAIGERKLLPLQSACPQPAAPLAATIEARRVCRLAHQQLKEELGPDHFEGRSWTGLHRHALIAMTAYAYLKAQRFAGAKEKNAPQGHHLSPASPSSGTPCNSYCLAR